MGDQGNQPPGPPPHDHGPLVFGPETLRAILAGIAMGGMLARGTVTGKVLAENAKNRADELLEELGV